MKTVPLEEVARLTVGFVGPMKAEYRQTGVPFLRSQNVQPHRLALDDVLHISEEFHARIRKSALRPGDVVIVRTGKPGTAAVVPDSLEEANCSDLVVVRPGRTLNPKWLSYFINTSSRAHVEAHTVGAVQQHFNVGSAARLAIPVVPIGEQEAVVEVLGTLDDKIAANATMATTAEKIAQNMFGSLALRAGRVPLTDLATPLLGGTPVRADAILWSGPVRWVSARDITGASHHVVLDTEERISEAASASAARLTAHPIGTVVLTARGTVGAVARLAEPAAINQSCYAFRPDASPAPLLYFAVRAAVDQMRAMAHGSVFSTVNMRTLTQLMVPDVRELSAHAGEIEAYLSIVVGVVRENVRLSALRDTLLPELMSGRLRVKDAERAVEQAL